MNAINFNLRKFGLKMSEFHFIKQGLLYKYIRTIHGIPVVFMSLRLTAEKVDYFTLYYCTTDTLGSFLSNDINKCISYVIELLKQYENDFSFYDDEFVEDIGQLELDL